MANARNTGVSSYHLSENPALYEPARSNTFDFIVPNIQKLLSAGIDPQEAQDEDYLDNFQEVIKLSVSEASVPNFNLGVVEVKRGNSTMKFAGAPEFSSQTITCNDYVGAATKSLLQAWQALAYNVADDVVELASKYKHDCYLVEYAPDFSKVIRKWTLKGCWVQTLNEGSFSHDSHDKRTIEVTIVYDRAIPETPSN